MAVHVHKDLIIAWANGAEIEGEADNRWFPAPSPVWNEETNYRIKPKKMVKKYRWCWGYSSGTMGLTEGYFKDEKEAYDTFFFPPQWLVKIEPSVYEFEE